MCLGCSVCVWVVVCVCGGCSEFICLCEFVHITRLVSLADVVVEVL